MERLTADVHLATARRLGVIEQLQQEAIESESVGETDVSKGNNTKDEKDVSDSRWSPTHEELDDGEKVMLASRLEGPMARAAHEKVIRRLLESGANMKPRYPDGRTTLYTAAHEGTEVCVRLLL